jgi:ribosomal subunit interface protein
MDIRVSGHRVDVGAALKVHVEERLNGIADKYFSRAIRAQTTFAKGPHDNGFVCDIVAHVMQGLVLKGSGNSPSSAHLAFDEAAAKVEKQLRRYMSRLKDRHSPAAAMPLPELDGAGYTVFQSSQEEEEPSDNPMIVAETRVDIPDSSVSDAVMMLDLRNTTALMFRNSMTGAFNMIYRREDGNIGWVEPRQN